MGTATSTALQSWRAIIQTPEVVAYFRGLFDRMAFTVEGTGEAFTATHHGDRITLAEGLDAAADFTVPLQRENIERMVEHARDGRISPEESWRIAAVLFTPVTQVTLRNPVMAKTWIRRIAGVEDLIHVRLVNPAGRDETAHTLIHAGGQWVVLAGLHGVARRSYRLTPDQSLEYQRHAFAAIKANSFAAWWRFARWYRTWRAGVSE